MKSKADKHREAGTLEAFRARQAASRAGTARYQERLRTEANDERRGDAEMRAVLQAVVDFAIEQGAEAAAFLRSWREGDTSDWPEFDEMRYW
jgi:hypothetical protein